MELTLRVAGVGPDPISVAIAIEGTVTGAALVAELRRFLDAGAPVESWWWARSGRRIVDDPDVLAAQPVDGDLVVAGPSESPVDPLGPGSGAATLEVLAGPDAGASFTIGRGSVAVGRSRDADITLADEAVSRRHFRIMVEADQVLVEDLGSRNGTHVGGAVVNGPTVLADGDEIWAGDSVLRVAVSEGGLGALDADVRWVDGTLVFNRPPRVIQPEPDHSFALPAPPELGAKRPVPWLMTLLPLVVGIPMVVLGMQSSGSAATAIGGGAFLLMSPVMMLGNYLSDRRQGGRTNAEAKAEYERRIADLEVRVAAAGLETHRYRVSASPEPNALLAWCRTRSARLWERRPRDPDFLSLRVGTADQPSLLEVAVPTAGRGADPMALDRNQALADAHRTDPGVPLTVPLDEVGVLGVHGPLDAAAGCLRSLVLQVAALHSPADVGVVAVVPAGHEADWEWLAWLPHCRRFAGGGGRTVTTTDRTAELLDAVEATMTAREAALEQRAAVAVRGPRLLLLLPESDLIPAARLGRILERGPRVGILALASAGSPAALPGECGALVALGPRGATVSFTRTGRVIAGVDPDRCAVADLDAAAAALAPLRDPAADEAAGVPASVSCADVAAFDVTDPEALRRRWSAPDPDLVAPIGLSAGGVVTVSLRRDGPHGVVAGTTGAGKSEFLQTFLALLAAHHSPERLAFVLIDLKGGAAFQDLARLPHTVGFFTDLDEHLAARALVSLNAEVRRREEVLRDAGVKDLMALEDLGRPGAPPSLLIVFDEFAVLKSEMPEFIDGIVDIARRGRSLGVHLVLATQSPTGVVDQHIRANTNLRVALRTADAQQSQDIIERSDAATIPRVARGRGWIRVGQDEPVLVQTAYSGRVGGSEAAGSRLAVGGFGLGGPDVALDGGPGPTSGPSDANRIIDAAIAAAAAAGIPPGAPPWLPPLPGAVALGDLPATTVGPGDLGITLGAVDEPARQAQDPFVLDLADPGNLAVFGGSGSGKSTLLRTVAVALAEGRSPAQVRLVVLDFATRGLRGLTALPHTFAYVTSDDAEVLERTLARLERELGRRRDAVAAAGAASFAEAQRMGALRDEPAIVILLDGLSAFVNEYEDVDLGVVVDQVSRIVSEGRSAGIHTVVTVDRRSGMPMSMAAAFPERIVLRMTEDDDYTWLGVPEARSVDFVAGRGLLPGGREIQVAVAGPDTTVVGQQDAVDALAARWSGPVDRLGPVPETVARPMPSGDQLVVGIDALTDEPVTVDLERDPWFLVTGADRSGRSTALATVVAGWRDRYLGRPVHLVAPRRTPLSGLDWTSAAGGVEELALLVERALDDARAGPVLVVVDDGDQLPDGGLGSPLDALLQRSRDLPVSVVASATAAGALRAYSGWLRDIRTPRRGLLLAPDPERDGEIFGGRVPKRVRRVFPPGRGYLVDGGDYRLVQVAVPIDD